MSMPVTNWLCLVIFQQLQFFIPYLPQVLSIFPPLTNLLWQVLQIALSDHHKHRKCTQSGLFNFGLAITITSSLTGTVTKASLQVAGSSTSHMNIRQLCVHTYQWINTDIGTDKGLASVPILLILVLIHWYAHVVVGTQLRVLQSPLKLLKHILLCVSI